MTLGELTARLQTLCHDGWAAHEARLIVNGWEADAGDIELVFSSDATADGHVRIRLGGE